MKKTGFKRRRKGSYRGSFGKDTKKLLAKGKKQLKKKDFDGAALTFEKSYKENKRNAECMSYYGLLSVLRWGKVGYGIELCTKAIKANTVNPDFYINLAKVYIYAKNIMTASTVLRKGLSIAPHNKQMQNMLYETGVRKKPYIPFLKWSNGINRGLDMFFKNTMPRFFKKRIPTKIRKRMEETAAKS